MKGITTLAALPNGAGQAAALPAEVGEATGCAWHAEDWSKVANFGGPPAAEGELELRKVATYDKGGTTYELQAIESDGLVVFNTEAIGMYACELGDNSIHAYGFDVTPYGRSVFDRLKSGELRVQANQCIPNRKASE